MPSAPPIAAFAKPAIWTGRILSAVVKFVKPVDALAHLGVALILDISIGVILRPCTVISTPFREPHAMTHLRAEESAVRTYVGALVWLRESRLSALIEFRN